MSLNNIRLKFRNVAEGQTLRKTFDLEGRSPNEVTTNELKNFLVSEGAVMPETGYGYFASNVDRQITFSDRDLLSTYITPENTDLQLTVVTTVMEVKAGNMSDAVEKAKETTLVEIDNKIEEILEIVRQIQANQITVTDITDSEKFEEVKEVIFVAAD